MMAISMAARRRTIALSRGAITISQYRAAEAKAAEAPTIPQQYWGTSSMQYGEVSTTGEVIRTPAEVTEKYAAPEPRAKPPPTPITETPYARIQREALITPAPPVEREERYVSPLERKEPAAFQKATAEFLRKRWKERKPPKALPRAKELLGIVKPIKEPTAFQRESAEFLRERWRERKPSVIGGFPAEPFKEFELTPFQKATTEFLRKRWRERKPSVVGGFPKEPFKEFEPTPFQKLITPEWKPKPVTPVAAFATVAIKEFGKELFVEIPKVVTEPKKTLKELKYAIEHPWETGRALKKEVITEPAKFIGRVGAWYALPKIPKVARRVAKVPGEVARVISPPKPIEIKAFPKYRWRREFPIPPRIEEAVGIRGKFVPADVEVIGRRAREVQLQLWPKVIREKPVAPITIPKAIPIPERIPTYKPGVYRPPGPLEKFLPPVLTEAQLRLLRTRRFKVLPEEQLVFKPRYKEVPSPRAILAPTVYPFKPVPRWRKPFVGKKAQVLLPPRERIYKEPRIAPRIIPEIKPFVRPAVIPEEIVYPRVAPVALAGLIFGIKPIEKVAVIPRVITKPKIVPKIITEITPRIITEPKAVQKARQKQRQRQKTASLQLQKTVQQQIQQQMPAVPTPTRLEIPFPKIPKVPPARRLLPFPEAREIRKRPPKIPLFKPSKKPFKTYAPTLWGYYGLPKIPARKELAKMVFTGILPRPGVKFPTRKKITKKKRRKR